MIMEMQVYISNLGKYNEDELVGAWFHTPISVEDVKEKIGLNDEHEESAIHDYEVPFTIHEYTSIHEINRLCAMVEELEGTPHYDELAEIQSIWFNNLEELLRHRDDIIYHSDYESMEDVATYYVEEMG